MMAAAKMERDHFLQQLFLYKSVNSINLYVFYIFQKFNKKKVVEKMQQNDEL